MKRKYVAIGAVLLATSLILGIWTVYYYTSSETIPFSGVVSKGVFAGGRDLGSSSQGVELSVRCTSNATVMVAITNWAYFEEFNQTRKLISYASENGSSVSFSWTANHTDHYVVAVAYAGQPASFSLTVTGTIWPLRAQGFYVTVLGVVFGGAMIVYGLISKPSKLSTPQEAEKVKKTEKA